MGFVKPLDENLLHEICKKYKTIVTAEDGVIHGGFGSAIAEFIALHTYSTTLTILGIPDAFIPHGTTEELHEKCGISPGKIQELLENIH